MCGAALVIFHMAQNGPGLDLYPFNYNPEHANLTGAVWLYVDKRVKLPLAEVVLFWVLPFLYLGTVVRSYLRALHLIKALAIFLMQNVR